MNDDQYLLANAYVDGELAADERAAAEADPAVMAEVTRLRALQSELKAVEPPSGAAREAAIAAALTEFVPATTPAAAPTRPFRPPPWYRRYLAIAAGVAAVGVLGVVVINVSDRGGDDDADIAADVAIDEAGDDRAGEAADEGDGATADAGRDLVESEVAATQVAEDDAAEAPAAAGDDTMFEAADDGDFADDGDAAAADDDMGDDAAAEYTLPPGAVAVVPSLGTIDPARVPEVDALEDTGFALRELRAAGELPASPETTCVFPDADDPSEILTRTDFVVDDGTVQLLVALDAVNGIVYGIDPDTCEIVVEAQLP